MVSRQLIFYTFYRKKTGFVVFLIFMSSDQLGARS